MIDVLVIGLVTAVGVVVLSPLRSELMGSGTVLFSPIVGTAVYVSCAVVLVSLASFSTVSVLVSMCIVGLVVQILWWRKAKPAPGEIKVLLLQLLTAVVGVSLLAAVIQWFPLTRVSFDSFWYLMSANALEQHGGMDSVPFGFNEILKRQLVIPAMQAPGVLAGRGYVVSWIPILAISALFSTVWIAWRGGTLAGTARTWRMLIGAAMVAFLITTNQLLFHAFYINGHMVFASFLVVGVGLSWYAAASAQWRLLIPASLALVALIPLRAEAVVVTIIFVLPIITTENKPTWVRWVLAIPIAGVTILWYGWAVQGALPHLAVEDRTTVFGNLALGVGLLVLAAIAGNSRLRPLVRAVPLMPLLVLVGVTLFQLATGPDQVWTTLSALALNMATEGLWSTLWWVVPPLVLGAYVAVSFGFQRYFVLPLVTFAVAVPVFAYLRGGAYRVGFGDSGNRMLMHVVFVVALYLMLAASTAAAEAPRRVGTDAD